MSGRHFQACLVRDGVTDGANAKHCKMIREREALLRAYVQRENYSESIEQIQPKAKQ